MQMMQMFCKKNYIVLNNKGLEYFKQASMSILTLIMCISDKEVTRQKLFRLQN